MRVLQSFTREPAGARTSPREDRYRKSNMDTVVLSGSTSRSSSFLSSAATAVVLGYGGWLAFNGNISIDPRRVPRLTLELLRPRPAAVAALQHIPVRRRGARQDHRPLGRGAEVLDSAARAPRPGGRPRRFEDVRFAYGRGPSAARARPRVPAGTTVALVGHTGAGKSTIAKLLARFYDRPRVSITIDGGRPPRRRARVTRRQLGIVPQEGFLFAGTVARKSPSRVPASASGSDRRGSRVGAESSSSASRMGTRHSSGNEARALTRSTPAGRIRTRAARGPAHPDPRRGDELGRHRTERRSSARCAAFCTADRVHHRAPPVDDPRPPT